MNKGNSPHLGIILLKLISRFPFGLLYLLSDLFFVVVYHIVGYRRKVVMKNLKNSFPHKTEKELKSIARKFYRHFADLTIETIKLGSIGETEFKKRMLVKNPEVIDQYFKQSKSVVVLTMHYNNWEWGSVFPLFLKHKILGVYRPLNNLQFDRYMNRNRARFGAEMVPGAVVLRRVVKAHSVQEPVFIWLAGDQTPPWFHKFWLMFLNQETMFYPGPATISRRFNYPVFFQRTIKKRRGYYETTFELLFENPSEFSETEIMKAYIKKMEEVINDQPENYLWSHRRWKNKRPADVPVKD